MIKFFWGENLSTIEKNAQKFLSENEFKSYSISLTSTVFNDSIIYCLVILAE